MDVPDLIGVHEARIAHHVAAVGQIDGEHGATAMFDRRGAVIVETIRHRVEVAPGEERFDPLEEPGLIASVSVKVP